MDKRIMEIAGEYGYASQSQMLIEEMAELTQAICKANRATITTTEEYFEHVKDEMADVHIMLLQMQFLLALRDEDLKERMNRKIERQLKRIEAGEE